MRRPVSLILAIMLVAPIATVAVPKIVFHTNGGVSGELIPGPGPAQRTVFRFGLPAGPPTRTWTEGPALRRLWVTNGIHYTQTVLLRPFSGTNLVLLVNVHGQNTNPEYTEAAAELELECSGELQHLELARGLLWQSNRSGLVVLGAFHIPETGIKVERGPRLLFHGNMPPSENGSMTLKLPLFALRDVERAEPLIDLAFEEEFRRAMRESERSNSKPPPVLVFAENDPGDLATVPAWLPAAPALDWSSGRVLNVRTTGELLAAVTDLNPGETISLANGEYRLPRTIVLDGKTNVTIRSASGDPAKVVLRGRGWDSGASGDDILHIRRCSGVTLADLTFADCRSYGVKVQAEDGPRDIRLHHCHFRDIGVRGLKGSAGNDPAIRAVGGSVRFCVFENTRIPPADWLFGGDYISGIDLMALEDWVISDNRFINIKGRNGGARAAIFIWVRSRRVTVERNWILGCDRGISFGNPGQSTANLPGEALSYVSDGIIRNNFICGGPDGGIELWHVDGVKVLHNSIWRPRQNWGRGIRVGTGTRRTEIRNNLVHGRIQREGGEAVIEGNREGELEGCFADPSIGDLRLKAGTRETIEPVEPHPEAMTDIRNRTRPRPAAPGAWQPD